MSTALNSNAAAPRSAGEQFFLSMCSIGVNAGVGAFAGHVLGIINPIGGAIFGATSTIAVEFADAIADKICMNRTTFKVVALVASFIAGIGIGMLVTTALGFPMTVLGTVGMTLAMVVTKFAMGLLIGAVTLGANSVFASHASRN